MSDTKLIGMLITRLRQLIHVHSVLYYYYHRPVVSDSTWDGWSNELLKLQAAYPSFVNGWYEPELFHDWTGDTGMHLPPTAYTDAFIKALDERQT